MRKSYIKVLFNGIVLVSLFVFWTCFIQFYDVQLHESTNSMVGFASLNFWFHQLTEAHYLLYELTDYLGLVPIVICIYYAGIGMVQLYKRKNLFKVDFEILCLGFYYIMVILCFILFETFPVNFRPVLIDAKLEASYPSSTVLLVLSVMCPFVFLCKRKIKYRNTNKWIQTGTMLFTAFMIIGRTCSGVHWITDIIASIFLSFGLFFLYKAMILRYDDKNKKKEG